MRGVVLGLVTLALVFSGCATDSGPETTAVAPSVETPRATVSPSIPPLERHVTASLDQAPLGLMARRLGELAGGGIVVMNGLNMYELMGPLELHNETIGATVQAIAAKVPCELSQTEDYFFLHASGPVYASLNAVSFDDAIDGRYRSMRASTFFGVDTPLFNAFALLGRTLNITLVGDNAVADALSGELAVGEVALTTALEALLKSARLNDQAVQVETTDEYIFLRHANNQSRPDLLLNAGAITDAQEAMLDRRVDVHLPRSHGDPTEVATSPGAHALGYILDALSEQLGIQVRADAGIEKLPVNPVVMNQVRVRTAMDLLIRQWLLPEFGYEVTGETIVIRHVGAS